MFDLQQKDCSKEAPATGNLSQCCSEMLINDESNLENAGFRFSISRLPKWARYQVTNNSLHMDIDSNSSKVKHSLMGMFSQFKTSILLFLIIFYFYFAHNKENLVSVMRNAMDQQIYSPNTFIMFLGII